MTTTPDEPTMFPQPVGPDSLSQAVASRLRARMATQKVSAADLAKRLENPVTGTPMDARYVQRRASGEIEMDLCDVEWFARALHLPPAALLADLL